MPQPEKKSLAVKAASIHETGSSDIYVEMFETGRIPGGKASTESFREQQKQEHIDKPVKPGR